MNAGTVAQTQCVASLTSSAPSTLVLDGSVTFPAIPAGGRATGQDTFTIRQDRRFPFDPNALAWTVACAGAPNTPPVADAGADQTVFTGAIVTLDGSGSTDADGDSLSFAWSFISRPVGSSATLNDPSAVMPTFEADVSGPFEIQLIVNDGEADSAPDVVVVTTIPENTAPVANAGADQFAFVGDLVTLDGTDSTDVDGDSLAFSWAFVSLPAGSSATLADANTALPRFIPDVAGDYIVRLTVADGRGGSSADEVTVTTEVRNQAPVANAGADQAVQAGETVNLDGSASFDPEGTPLSFAWSFVSRPTGSTAVLTNPTTATPSFIADRAGDFLVQLIVSDGELSSAADTVLITTNNTPPVADAGPDQTVDAGELVQLDGTNSVDANDDPLAFIWSLTTRPVGSVATLLAQVHRARSRSTSCAPAPCRSRQSIRD